MTGTISQQNKAKTANAKDGPPLDVEGFTASFRLHHPPAPFVSVTFDVAYLDPLPFVPGKTKLRERSMVY